MEVKHRLLNYGDLSIIQRKDMFNFSLDTVLLANFATINKDVKQILDIGTNNCAIPLLLSTRTNKKIVGVEIQEEAIEIANKNIILNHLETQIEVVHSPIQEYSLGNNENKYDLIVCNPPFFKIENHNKLKDNTYLQIARHEIKINLEEIILHAARLLQNKGRFALIHRPDRLVDIIMYMDQYDIAPKRLRFVYPKKETKAHMVLVEGMYKGKKEGLIIESPLYAHKENGEYSEEVQTYFGGKNEKTKEF